MEVLGAIILISLAGVTGAQNKTEPLPDYCLLDDLDGCPCFKNQCRSDIEVRFSCIKSCNSCAEVMEYYRKLDAEDDDTDSGLLRRRKRSSLYTNMKMMSRVLARQKRDDGSLSDNKKKCKDKKKFNCPCWKNLGYCKQSADHVVNYMKMNCPKTCKFCSS